MGLTNFIRLLKNPLVVLAWSVVAIISYYFFDRAVAVFIHHLNNATLTEIARSFSFFGYGFTMLLILAVLALLAWLLQRSSMAKCLTFAVAAIAANGIICDIIKFIVNRSRPFELFWQHKPLYGFYFFHYPLHMNSFPSGHATVITSAMMALSLAWPRWWKLFMTFALLVSLSRLLVLKHFISDIMVGMYLGAMGTVYLQILFNRYALLRRWLPKQLTGGVV